MAVGDRVRCPLFFNGESGPSYMIIIVVPYTVDSRAYSTVSDIGSWWILDEENNGDDCVHREEEWGKTMEIAQRGKLSDAGINPFSMMLPCSQYVRPINLLPPDRDAYLIASGSRVGEMIQG